MNEYEINENSCVIKWASSVKSVDPVNNTH